MISVANLFDMEEEIDRRSFVRRLFAMGAGIAASGSLVRALAGSGELSGRARLMMLEQMVTKYDVGVDRAGFVHVVTPGALRDYEALIGRMTVRGDVAVGWRDMTVESGRIRVE